jgi:hypothetical protein
MVVICLEDLLIAFEDITIMVDVLSYNRPRISVHSLSFFSLRSFGEFKIMQGIVKWRVPYSKFIRSLI